MEILDCFCGIGPWARRDRLLPYRPEEIVTLMDHFGVAQALVHSNLAANGGWVPEANQILSDMVKGQPRFLPAFTLAPLPHDNGSKADYFAAEMRACGARAAWLWPQGHGMGGGLWSWLIGDLLAMCSERRIPVLMHAEDRNPNDIETMLSEFPRLRLILAGLSYGSDKWLFPLLRRHEGLHVCLGHYYIPPGGPLPFLRHFTTERLIFGSGLPKFSPGGLIAHVMYAPIGDDAKETILGGNLRRLLSEARP